MKSIQTALAELDHSNDDLWTDDGAPKVDAVAGILGRPVSRADIIAAAPKFVRGSDAPVDPMKHLRQPEPEEPKPSTDPHERARLEQARDETLVEMDREVQAATDALEKAKKALDAANARRDEYLTQVPEGFDHNSDQAARMAIIHRNQEERAAKVLRSRDALKGVDPKDLDPRTPLDRAYASRRKGRGETTPNRGLIPNPHKPSETAPAN